VLHLQPWEWRDWTPRELAAAEAPILAQREDDWYRTAWLAATVRVTIWDKRGRTPDELLGRKPVVRQKLDPDEAERRISALFRR